MSQIALRLTACKVLSFLHDLVTVMDDIWGDVVRPGDRQKET
jgi:hypothetical protein